MNGEITEQAALAALSEVAAQLTGFSTDAVQAGVLRRMLRRRGSRGQTAAGVVDAARRREPETIGALLQAVSVGETYFFRHPDQFRFLLQDVLPAQAATGRPWRAWSAGCATGEEAWSLAGCVRAVFSRAADVRVLGTDLLQRNLKSAERAVYGRWSVRAAGPELTPVYKPAGDGHVTVLYDLQPLVSFEQHNLLDAPPSGPFDLILCRNVLVYFSADAAARVVEHLRSVLTPDGILLFGPMDLTWVPEGLARSGPVELQAFEHVPAKPAEPARLPETPRRLRSRLTAPAPPGPAPQSPEPVEVHLKALSLIERGDEPGAGIVLERLCAESPDYVPGLAEYAMLLVRRGEIAPAAARMRQVLRLVATLPAETALPGPESLPAEYYVSSAETLLERLERSAR